MFEVSLRFLIDMEVGCEIDMEVGCQIITVLNILPIVLPDKLPSY